MGLMTVYVYIYIYMVIILPIRWVLIVIFNDSAMGLSHDNPSPVHIEHPLCWVFLPGIGTPQTRCSSFANHKNARLDCTGC